MVEKARFEISLNNDVDDAEKDLQVTVHDFAKKIFTEIIHDDEGYIARTMPHEDEDNPQKEVAMQKLHAKGTLYIYLYEQHGVDFRASKLFSDMLNVLPMFGCEIEGHVNHRGKLVTD